MGDPHHPQMLHEQEIRKNYCLNCVDAGGVSAAPSPDEASSLRDKEQ